MLAPQTAAMQDDHQIVRPVILATDVEADLARVFEALSTTQGQQSFRTADCEVSGTAPGDAGRSGIGNRPAGCSPCPNP